MGASLETYPSKSGIAEYGFCHLSGSQVQPHRIDIPAPGDTCGVSETWIPPCALVSRHLVEEIFDSRRPPHPVECHLPNLHHLHAWPGRRAPSGPLVRDPSHLLSHCQASALPLADNDIVCGTPMHDTRCSNPDCPSAPVMPTGQQLLCSSET